MMSSGVLARADEYVADRCAVELAGASPAAEALLQVELKGRYLEKSFWPEVHKQVDQEPEPPARLFSSMLPALQNPVPPDDAAMWLDQALAEETGYADTHPSLTDRLTAIGYLKPAEGAAEKPRPPLPSPPEETAAQQYCGAALDMLVARLDQAWRDGVAPHWRERYTYAQETQRRLAQLEEKAQREPLTDEEAWNRAEWTAEFRGAEAALPSCGSSWPRNRSTRSPISRSGDSCWSRMMTLVSNTWRRQWSATPTPCSRPARSSMPS